MTITPTDADIAEAMAALVKILRASRKCKDGITRKPHQHERKAADLIEAMQSKIATARQEGFAAGVEAAAKVAQGVCDKDLSPSDGVTPTDVLDAIRSLLQTSDADGK